MHLGVCAAEGLKNESQNFDPSESRRSDCFDATKGSETPEAAIFLCTHLGVLGANPTVEDVAVIGVPRTATGKILHRVLRQRLVAA